MTGHRLALRAAAPRRQAGIAAVEFALVFVVIFMIFYGIATFGAVLYTQQAVSRAAEDGARAAALLTALPMSDADKIRGTVYDSLAGSLVVPTTASSSLGSRRTWIANHVSVTVAQTGATPNANVVVTVTYPYSANRLLPTMPLLDTSRWMPDNLHSRATAVRPS